MIHWLWRAWRQRREARERASLDALKVRYHTFRILLANNERALDRLGKVEAALAAGATTNELAGAVEDLLAVTFEMVDGLARLAANGSNALYARQLRLEEALRAALETTEDAGRGPSCLPLAHPLEVGEVGGKAAGLSLLLRNGFPVPDGFAVTARACREFLRETGLEERIRQTLAQAGKSDTGLGTACAAIRRDILATPLPEWLGADLRAASARLAGNAGDDAPLALAARSSALTEDHPDHSFAGQFTTELNLAPEALEQGFSAVMAGAFTERAVAYRREAGLPPTSLDMVVLVQVMVAAVAAGVAFTMDPVRPEAGRMLVSAVPGLGVLAVNGAVAVDIYRVDRDDPTDVIARLARKTRRAVANPAGGILREAVPPHAQARPVLGPAVLTRLSRLALAAEALAGSYRDLEYAVDAHGRVWLLQSRPARIIWGKHRPPAAPRAVYQGGMTASPGRCLGLARHMVGEAALDEPVTGPVIAVLPTAAPEAARRLPLWQGVVVAGGNPVDHLSTVARESGRPMLTRARDALADIADGSLVVLDAAETRVTATPPAIGDITELLRPPGQAMARIAAIALSPQRARLHDLIVPLTLANASGAPFSVLECRTLHDSIRFAHETAVQALFDAGDGLHEAALSQVRPLGGEIPFEFRLIDLGGGLREETSGRQLTPDDIASIPLAALWRGLATPGLRLDAPLRGPDAGGRPPGGAHYALAARDYVNVNIRLESHCTMVDAVCGPRARGNYVRLRSTGGNAATPLRQRRALCLATILDANGFFVHRHGDLVTANLSDATEEATAAALVVLGRLLGFTRLFDAAMTDDEAPHRAAEAFLAGDYGLEGLDAASAH